MSRIGKNPVDIPEGVSVVIEGQEVTVKGKLGKLNCRLATDVEASQKDGKIWVRPVGADSDSRAMWGLGRTMVGNMVSGVSQGFSRKLEIVGVGYRAAVENKILTLQLGYSHEINFDIPEGIKIAVEKQTTLKITGSDKQLVGEVASKIKTLRKIEPYKGKGVREKGQYVLKKEGKKK